jgi:hypothetical protein
MTEHRAEQAAERLQAGNLWEDTGFVFATEFGCPVDPRNLLRMTTLAAKRAGLPPAAQLAIGVVVSLRRVGSSC